MSSDYIPASDTDFDAWQANFLTYANANKVALGLSTPTIIELQTRQDVWRGTFESHVAAQAAAESARQDKDDGRKEYQAYIRNVVRGLQASTTVTDPQRQGLGITVRDTTHTPVGPPTTRPVATVETRERLRQTIHFADEATPQSKAKPAGVIGAEIWLKVGTPPTDTAELHFLALDTRTPYTADFLAADGGKTAYYMLRWVNTKGEKGPWSATYSATVMA
jgi:hypothetical protein